MVCRLAGVVLAALVCVPAVAHAQDAKSGDLARRCVALLDAKKIQSIAAADLQNPGTFVAALYVPGAQLLVVSAQYTAPAMLTDLLARKDYRGVYVELVSASVQSSRLMVLDANANGLLARPPGGQAPDSVERAGAQATFDGGWKKAKMTEADYMKSFADADAAYARMLQMLIAQLKNGSSQP
jgi:hypothetical protein